MNARSSLLSFLFFSSFFYHTMSANACCESKTTQPETIKIETFGCKVVPATTRKCPRIERPPHKPHESSYYASRNRTIYPRAHSSSFAVSIREPFNSIFFRDLEYEPFVTTRNMEGFLGQQVYLLPREAVLDANCQDINAKATIQGTYLHALIGDFVVLPEAFRANPYADFIVEFYSPTGYNLTEVDAINQGIAGGGGIALVYAALYLDWEKTALIFGRSWNPWVDPEIQVSNQRVTTIGCLAETLRRDYQIRITQEVNRDIDLIAAAIAFLDDKITTNNNGFRDQDNFLFNNIQMDFHLQCRMYHGDNIYAAGFDAQSVKPAKFDNWTLIFDQDPVPFERTNIFKTKARVGAVNGFVFAKVATEHCTLRAKVAYGPNLINELGGYTVAARSQCRDEKGCKLPPHAMYLPLRFAKVVGDVQIPLSCDDTLETGLFFSYFKNYGASQPIYKLDPTVYPDRTGNRQFLMFNIYDDHDYCFSMSPRVKWHSNSVSLCGEIEYTRLAHGCINDFGAVVNASPVDNLRFIFSAQCFF